MNQAQRRKVANAVKHAGSLKSMGVDLEALAAAEVRDKESLLKFPFINSEDDVREHMQYRGMYYNIPELKRLSSREARQSVEDIINQTNIY